MKKGLIIGLAVGGAILLAAAVGAGVTYLVRKANTVTQTYDLDKTFNSIKVDVETSDIEFVKSNEGIGKVICTEAKDYKHIVVVENETLKVSFDHKYRLNFGFMSPDFKVQIYVPSSTEYSLEIVHTTGNLDIGEDFTFSDVKVTGSTGNNKIQSNVKNTVNVKCSTGRIYLANMNPTSIFIESSTGESSLKDINCSGDITMQSTTGRKVFDNVKAKNLQVKSSTGSTRLSDVIIASKLDIDSTTGDVDIKKSDATEINIKLTTGDVNAEFLTSKIVYAKSNTGDVDVPKSTTGGLCSIETRTGSIKVVFKN